MLIKTKICNTQHYSCVLSRYFSIFTRLKTRLFILLSSIGLLLGGCDGYNKLLKSTDFELKAQKAQEYFDKKDYVRASQLYEEIIPAVKGTPKAESIYYNYTWCEYYIGDFLLSQYHFKNYTRQFPDGKHVEECYYMNAYCYFLNSPNYQLDQTYTKNAIKEFQAFLDAYPQSSKIDTCNALVDKLREKLERKDYEIVKQYYKVEDWKASIVSIKNFLKEYPNSKFSEELYFLLIDSYFVLAERSVYAKKEERLQGTMENYVKFAEIYPNSSYLSRAENRYNSAKRLLDNLHKDGF